MRKIGFIVVLCISWLIFGWLCGVAYEIHKARPDIVMEEIRLSDEARRENLLMPQKDSKPWREWVAKYGDNADSWTLFTLGFHTKYLGELNKRLTLLEKAQDSNELTTTAEPD